MSNKTRLLKRMALLMIVLLLNQVLFPTIALALTGGPSQPEVRGFEPIGTSDMVNLFTGDFQYNIPLMDVDGYPINVAYQADPTMDAEASWVGLGWSLNPGTINRDLRGFPDDFKGDEVKKEFNIKENQTVGVGVGIGFELFGIKLLKGLLSGALALNQGIYYNTYTGFGKELGFSPSLSFGKSGKTLTAGLGLDYNPQSGINASGNVSFSIEKEATRNGILSLIEKRDFKLNAGGYNSRSGLKNLSVNLSYHHKNHNYKMLSKTDKEDRFGRASSAFFFGSATYFPTSNLPLLNAGFSFHGTLGGELIGAHPNGEINGYVSLQALLKKSDSQQAYGYLHSSLGVKQSDALLDFNWNKQGPFRENTPNIPMAFGTYDIFSASGQGVGGQFRASRNDIGMFRNPTKNTTNIAGNGGGELGLGAFFHAGFNINVGTTSNVSRAWTSVRGNKIADVIPFTETDKLYEAVYFKNTGESVVTETNFYNQVGGNNPIVTPLRQQNAKVYTEKKFRKESNQQEIGYQALNNQTVKRDNREKRNETFSYTTADEAAKVSLEPQLLSHPKNTITYNNTSGIQSIDRNPGSSLERGHHISEITINQTGGRRYIYGIPAYNNLQKEVSFSTHGISFLGSTFKQDNKEFTLVPYNIGTSDDNTVKNKKGKDNYFDSREIPPYAHSYLLTSILSPDYADVTGNGITEDDLGTAIKLNYTKAYDGYRWRVPYRYKKAKYHGGYKTDKSDDKASYFYGEKEIWYAHSIESKTMLAQFYTSNRDDALGVLSENGSKDTLQRLQKLDSIVLYAKSELIKRGSNAKPIKTVHFEYDYSLCPEVPNQMDENKGKLTLKKIYFTYNHSNRGQLNAYHFGYNQPGGQFKYNIGHYDRWGGYKENPIDAPDNYPNNMDFPYALQDSIMAHHNIAAWNLKSIELPSGGKMTITYEPDDYAYVQNKRAGQMMFIAGFTDDPVNGSPINELYTKNDLDINKYLVVNLPYEVADANEMRKRYLEDVKKEHIYFQCLIDMKKEGEDQEYIKGYFPVDTISNDTIALRTFGGQQQMVIPVKPLATKGTDIHPISKAALQTMRLELPELAYPGYNSTPDNEGLINALIGFGNEINNIVRGFDKASLKKEWAQKVDVNNKSWIRLANPTFNKYGGGSRVKKIILSDEWTITNGGGKSNYGQEYEYTAEISVNGKKIRASSGVASYEPTMGNEENLMRNPTFYEEERMLAPNNYYYNESPIGEVLYPAPIVGYSEVKVKNLSYENVRRTATGYTINKYYTAKDFPVISSMTAIDKKRTKPDPIKKFLKVGVKDFLTVAQGFQVEVNDMHGKPKEVSIYNAEDALISSNKYFYKVKNEHAQKLQLNNEVRVVNTDGSITTRPIGLEIDVWNATQEEENNTKGLGAAFNADGFPVIIFPGVTTTILPILQQEITRFRSNVTTKLIKRFGLLEKVVAMENGSTITTENLLYDAETGATLLSKTENEFDDPLYQFTYPAHWAYEEMGQAYKNIGGLFTDIEVDGGLIQDINPNLYFVPGDELVIKEKQIDSTYTVLPNKYYITQPSSQLVVSDEEGYPLDLPGKDLQIKIIRSGRRNLADAALGSITSKEIPIDNESLEIDSTKNILQCAAVEFSDIWPFECREQIDACGNTSFVTEIINPYFVGLKGNWRPKRTYAFYDTRSPATIGSTNIQEDGEIDNFVPFWLPPTGNGKWTPINPLGSWTLSNEIIAYDQRGNKIESQDAIGIYTATYFGYNYNRAIAIASNAERREITNENFEDYFFQNANGTAIAGKNLTLFDKNRSSADYTLEENITHTGKVSLKLSSDFQINIKKSLSDACVQVGGSFTSNENNSNRQAAAVCAYSSSDGIHATNHCCAA